MFSIVCEFDVIGMSPIGFSAPVRSVKKEDEAHDTYEDRTWKERAHVNKDGHLFIPPQALKNALLTAAKYRPRKVKGGGAKTYTKFIEAGLLVVDPMVLADSKGKPLTIDNVFGNRLFVPSDGVKGGGKRVWKTFPTLNEWQTHAVINVLEPMLLERPNGPTVLRDYVDIALKFVGFGQFRPERGGYFGRGKKENFVMGKGALDGTETEDDET